MSFDFGTEVASSGKGIKQASEGPHEGRVIGIVHLGMIEDEYEGKKKPAAPFVCILAEIIDDEEDPQRNEDGSPIVVHKTIALKKGNKAALHKFMTAVLSAEDLAAYKAGTLEGGMDDLIGNPIGLQMESNGKENKDGESFVNLKAFNAMTPKAKRTLREAESDLIGHVRLEQITPDVLRELPPFVIWSQMEQAINFPGSAAELALAEIRKDNPDFGTKRTGDDDEKKADGVEKPATTQAPPPDLDETQDFS